MKCPNSNEKLTNDTYEEIHKSTSVLISFVKLNFKRYEIKYFLPGVLQTDDLEKDLVGTGHWLVVHTT